MTLHIVVHVSSLSAYFSRTSSHQCSRDASMVKSHRPTIIYVKVYRSEAKHRQACTRLHQTSEPTYNMNTNLTASLSVAKSNRKKLPKPLANCQYVFLWYIHKNCLILCILSRLKIMWDSRLSVCFRCPLTEPLYRVSKGTFSISCCLVYWQKKSLTIQN